jgi:iron complex outermembrane receptor protein
MTFTKALAGVSLLAISGTLLHAPAMAQTRDGISLEEIIVTGTRRDTNLIETPVAVQVFTETQIDNAGITRPQDYLNLTPNVTFIQANHAGEAFVNIRGQTSVRQSESAVAVVIDGVQLATQNEFNGDLFDIEQIEVLKGPQGALYGRNAAAGAIVVRTIEPTDDYEGKVVASYGNWNTMRVAAGFGGPIIPGKLRFRASAAMNDTDGPFQNIISGENVMRVNEKNGRLRLMYEGDEGLNLDFKVQATRLDGGGIAANAQGPNIVNGGVPSPVNTSAVDSPFVSDTRGGNRQDKFSTSLRGDYDFEGFTVSSVTAYSQITDNYEAPLFPYQAANDPRNDAGNAILFGDQTQKYRIAQNFFQQEIRFTSDEDQRLRWQAGIYFLTGDRNFTTEEGYNGRVPLNADGTPNVGVDGYLPNPEGAIRGSLDPAISTAIFGDAFDRWDRLLIGGGVILPTRGIDGLDTVNPTNAYDISEFGSRNIAPFANVQYDITENLEINVAARYDIERRTVETQTPDVINPFTGTSFNRCVNLFGLAADECQSERTFKQLQPKVTLTYKMPDISSSVYASWGRSFKSGGFNAFGSREIVVRATAVGITREEAEALVFVNDSYEKEVADQIEVGFKTRQFDDRLTFNIAGFWTDIEDSQQFIFFPAGSIQAVASLDNVEILGIEADATFQVTDTLTAFGAVGFIDAEIKESAAQPAAVGNRPPYVSDYNITLGLQLDQPITDALNLLARVEYNRQGSVWFDAVNTPNTRRDPIDLVNARLGIASDNYEFSLWARNLNNERYRVETVTLVTGVGTFNPGFLAPPRSYGVEAKLRF